LPHDWSGEIDYNWGRFVVSDRSAGGTLPTLSGAIGNGTIDVLRDVNAFPLDLSPYILPRQTLTSEASTSEDTTLHLAGPVYALPAGEMTLSGLIEHRSDAFDNAFVNYWSGSNQSILFIPNRSQSVNSAYLELSAPLFSTKNALPGLQELELQIALRRDEYQVNGVTGSVVLGSNFPITRAENKTESTDPTVALRFKPVSDLMLRASYGTGFLPPSVQQIAPTLSTLPGTYTDPRRGNAVVTLPGSAIASGGNPGLKPEQSESWSAGTVLTPRFLDGLRLSVDYVHINKTNNIASPFSGGQDLINHESLVPGRVIRGPASDDPLFGVGELIGINNSLFNIAKAQIAAYDVALDYQMGVYGGTLSFYSLATWQTHYKTQLLATSPAVENVGVTYQNPLKFKGNAGVNFQKNGWTFEWSTRYFDSYLGSTVPTTVLSQGDGGRIPSQTYHDAFFGYRFTNGVAIKLLQNTEWQLSIANIFNTYPPVDLNNILLPYSPFGDPKLRSFMFSIKKSI